MLWGSQKEQNAQSRLLELQGDKSDSYSEKAIVNAYLGRFEQAADIVLEALDSGEEDERLVSLKDKIQEFMQVW